MTGIFSYLVFFACIVLILGILALVNIPIDILPALNVKAIKTLAFNNGMNAEMVEKTLTAPMCAVEVSFTIAPFKP
jgi:multidrug efflux pump subunit AcrB